MSHERQRGHTGEIASFRRETPATEGNSARHAQDQGIDPDLIGDVIVDGPRESLHLLAWHLGFASKATTIDKSFAAHPSPRTLQALAAVASDVGLETRAFRGERAALSRVALPAIVHLRNPHETAHSGFAVLLECDARGVLLDVGSRGEKYLLSDAEFTQLWSGIVVTITCAKPAGADVEERTLAGRLRRAWRLFLGGDEVYAQATLDRHVAVLLLILAGVGGGLRTAMAGGVPAGVGIMAWVLLCELGAFLSYDLGQRRARIGGSATTGRLVDRLCGIAKWADCEGVLTSKWGVVFGVEISSLGLAFFGAALFGGRWRIFSVEPLTAARCHRLPSSSATRRMAFVSTSSSILIARPASRTFGG